MRLKTLAKVAHTSWCPVAGKSGMMVSGSVAGTLDEDFGAGAKLEIHEVDLASCDSSMQLLGSTIVPERFTVLAWGAHANYGMGIIAGGMEDGTIGLWNAEAIVGSFDAENAGFIGTLAELKACVKDLAFNPFQSSLLASSSADGQTLIWSIEDPEHPKSFPPAPTNPQASQEISCLSWNRKFQQILATASTSGLVVVWDLKTKKSIANFSTKSPISCLSWSTNVEESTKLVVGIVDDENPSVQVWDLKRTVAPINVFKGHSGGVLSLSWSPHDPSLVLSTGKDSRILCWNPETLEILSEFPAPEQWAFRVQWSPRIPAVFSTSSFDQRVEIFSLQDISGPSGPSQQAPKWLKCPVGAAFAFGGKLVRFGPGSHVRIQKVHTDHTLSGRARTLLETLQRGSLQDFVINKMVENEDNAEEKMIWRFMNLLLEDRSDQQACRDELFQTLGLDTAEMTATLKRSVENGVADRTAVVQVDDSERVDILLQNALLLRDFSTAVELAFEAGRLDEAILIASAGDAKLVQETTNRYFALKHKSFHKILEAIVKRDMLGLVEKSAPEDWRHVVAVVNSTSTPEQFSHCCDLMAAKLETADMTTDACLCAILSGNIDRVMHLWTKHAAWQCRAPAELHNTVEKLAIMTVAVHHTGSSALLMQVFRAYAELLAMQGDLEVALCILASLKVQNEELQLLQHRLWIACGRRSELPNPNFVLTPRYVSGNPNGTTVKEFGGLLVDRGVSASGSSSSSAGAGSSIGGSGAKTEPEEEESEFMRELHKADKPAVQAMPRGNPPVAVGVPQQTGPLQQPTPGQPNAPGNVQRLPVGVMMNQPPAASAQYQHPQHPQRPQQPQHPPQHMQRPGGVPPPGVAVPMGVPVQTTAHHSGQGVHPGGAIPGRPIGMMMNHGATPVAPSSSAPSASSTGVVLPPMSGQPAGAMVPKPMVPSTNSRDSIRAPEASPAKPKEPELGPVPEDLVPLVSKFESLLERIPEAKKMERDRIQKGLEAFVLCCRSGEMIREAAEATRKALDAMESGQDCKDLLSQMSRGDVWNAVKHFHTALKYMNHFFKS